MLTNSLRQATSAARACDEPLQPLGDALQSLTGNIDHTGAQMHRIALNTILIAVRHGSGTGLEVLAENTAATGAKSPSSVKKPTV